ncbi:phosphoesterase [Erysipelotrichaceae bacterium OPF54]|nr:phosphoesterase [Erysipelotrichaceae bacterium OPF54]
MSSTIDLHSHIAWDIDDGMPNKEDALVSLENAKKDGIVAICSTPHYVGGQMNDEAYEDIHRRQQELAMEAARFGIKIYAGAEMFMDSSFLSMLENEWYQTINNSAYLLCEYNVQRDIHTIQNHEDMLYEVEVRGMVPVIAHAERYFHKGLDMEIIDGWKEQGYLFQVNRTSLQGMHGKTIQENAWKLLEEGYAHIICTDTHRANGHRVEQLSDIYEEVEQQFGSVWAQELLYKNPLRILNNRRVRDLKMEDKVQKKKSFFSFGR